MMYASLERLADALPDASTLSLVRNILDKLRDLRCFSTGTRQLPGGIGLILSEYMTAPWSQGVSESHRRFLDLVIVLEGEEYMLSSTLAKQEILDPYDSKTDNVHYANASEDVRIRLTPGHYVLYTPSHVHHPGVMIGRPTRVRKATFKIPIQGNA